MSTKRKNICFTLQCDHGNSWECNAVTSPCKNIYPQIHRYYVLTTYYILALVAVCTYFTDCDQN